MHFFAYFLGFTAKNRIIERIWKVVTLIQPLQLPQSALVDKTSSEMVSSIIIDAH
jgi:hypothetical protein